MPTYQYACTESTCGHRFDAVQAFSDKPLDTCPVCEGRLRKVFSAVGVVFKGSGFYRTDSRAESRAGNGKSGPSEAKTSGSSDTAGAVAGSSGSAGSGGSAGGGTTSSSGSSGSSGSSVGGSTKSSASTS